MFDNVTKSYGNIKALDSISFEVENGSITGFVGPNGAGKTTSIRIMAGLLLPERGSVRINGENPFSSIKMRERTFFIMDTINIPPNANIYDYFLHLSKIYQFDSSSIKDAFKSLDIWPARNRTVRQLSAGMKQKAQLAIALCASADLIIADEPASNMDPTARMQLYETITRINRERKTTFFISSHILTELERVIDSVIIIGRGRKLTQSKISDFKSRASGKYGVNALKIHVSDIKAASTAVRVLAVEGNAIVVSAEPGQLGRLITAIESAGVTVLSVEKERFDLGEVFSEVVSNEQIA